MTSRRISTQASSKEVLFALFGAIYPAERAEALSERLLTSFGSLSRLMKADHTLLSEQIGNEAALYLRLSLALSIRRITEVLKAGDRVNEEVLVRHFDALYRGCGQESVYILLTDGEERLLSYTLLSVGASDTSGISPRQLLEHALRAEARGAYLLHNHPGGDPTPSLSDERATQAADAALSAAGIRFFGHYIFADGAYAFIKQNGAKCATTIKEIR